MPDLERDLRELGAALEYPPTPDVAGAVRGRLAAAPGRRGFPLRRALVLGFAALAVAVGAVMAVPQARTAILEWLGLRGVEIERVPTQPRAPAAGAGLGLGERVTLAEARRRARFRVAASEEKPDAVYFSALAPGGQVAYVYGSERNVHVLVTQFRARIEEAFIRKTAGPQTRVARVTVNGEPGFWLAGAPHELVYLDPDGEPIFETLRLAGNTLLWQRGEVTLRLEGDLTKTEALRLAESLR